MPPRVVMRPQTMRRIQGGPRPVRVPSSESASAKPMLMPAPIEAARAARKRSGRRPGAMCARGDREGVGADAGSEGGGEERGQRADAAVHEAGEAGLNNLQHE